MKTTFAKLIQLTSGEGEFVVLDVAGNEVVAMDCLVYGRGDHPRLGEELAVEFTFLHDEDEDWESIFSANPDRVKSLKRIGAYSYRVLGQLLAPNQPTSDDLLVDCGVCLLPAPVDTNDPRCYNQYVGFTVTRLDVWRKHSDA